MSSQRRGGLHFVHLTHPDDAGKWKRQVRSHAARNSPARQKRVIRHQNEKANDVMTLDRAEANSSACSRVSGNVVSQDTCIPDISLALSAARTDPFDTFVSQITRFESFLLDYCESHYCPSPPPFRSEIEHNEPELWVETAIYRQMCHPGAHLTSHSCKLCSSSSCYMLSILRYD
jgi:hypothetical protein